MTTLIIPMALAEYRPFDRMKGCTLYREGKMMETDHDMGDMSDMSNISDMSDTSDMNE